MKNVYAIRTKCGCGFYHKIGESAHCSDVEIHLTTMFKTRGQAMKAKNSCSNEDELEVVKLQIKEL